MSSCTLLPDDGELGHRGAHKALLEAGVAAEQEPEHGDHDQQQGRQREEERVVGDHRGERAASIVAELPHDRERESKPPETLLHTVNGPQQPFDTLHASTSPQKPGPAS
jgi:hypothetical protein